jgi:DNA polymerase (family 10)
VAVKGLGPALQRKIVAGLEAMQSARAARHVHRAEELLSAAEESFKRSNLNLKKIVVAGDLRRGCELVSNWHWPLNSQAGRHRGYNLGI